MNNLKDKNLIISGINSEGEGITRLNDKVCFVPNSAPGDIISITQMVEGKSFNRVYQFKLIESSTDRVQPICKLSEQCGGCCLMHLNYPLQTQLKRDSILWNYRKFAKVKEIEKLTAKCVKSPQLLNYRDRIQLHVKNNQFGFYSKKSHDLIPIKECHLVNSQINEYLKTVDKKHTLINGDDFQLSLNQENGVTFSTRKDNNSIHFQQVNKGINQLIIDKIIAYHKDLDPADHILDLYCGNGNLSIPLNSFYNKLTGVDCSKSNIDLAKANSSNLEQINSKFTWIKADCKNFINQIPKKRYDTVIIDPPRCGLKKNALILAQKQIKRIIYLSCNPATQATDVKNFLDLGYQIKSITPYDMFPQTHHIESLVICERLIR